MSHDFPLRCRCGYVRGIARDVSPSGGFRLVCYCTDCQAFARFLDRLDTLDMAGGTGILQMPPARVTLTMGLNAVRCLRRSERVLRWYADCCRTPIANTASSPRFPLVGLNHAFMDTEACGCSMDQLLGRPVCRIYEHSAAAPLPPDAPPPPSFGTICRRGGKLLMWRARGLDSPNPFFDNHTMAPLCAPLVLGR